MSGGEPPRRNTVLWGSLLLLALVAVAYVANELVQRHRFKRMEVEVKEGVDDLAANARFDLDDQKRLLLIDRPDGRGMPLKIYNIHGEDLAERETSWIIYAQIGGSAGKTYQFTLFTGQDRRFILGSPFVGVNLQGSTLISIPDAVESRLKARGLPYREYFPPK